MQQCVAFPWRSSAGTIFCLEIIWRNHLLLGDHLQEPSFAWRSSAGTIFGFEIICRNHLWLGDHLQEQSFALRSSAGSIFCFEIICAMIQMQEEEEEEEEEAMQLLKLGSKPDFFYSDGDGNIAVDSELPSDVTFVVEGKRFYLHKYPLLTKCGYLQSLCTQQKKNMGSEISVDGIPGGCSSFELCAKFCYGITVSIHAFCVMAVRCASEYLGMTESLEKGNLGYKLDLFLSSVVLHSWKDCIISLQSTMSLQPWADDLNLVSGCVDSISTQVCMDPSTMAPSLKQIDSPIHPPSDSQIRSHPNDLRIIKIHGEFQGWWIEDLCELDIDLFHRVLLAIRSTGRVAAELVGESLRAYAFRWLPGLSQDQHLMETMQGGGYGDSLVASTKHRHLLETIVSLLPSEKGSMSCSFLLKLLKASNLLMAAPSTKSELARRIGMQLEEASLNDLFIPSLSYASDSLYDVDLIHSIVKHYAAHLQACSSLCNQARTLSSMALDSFDRECMAPKSDLRVAKLIDGYLGEIARDPNLALQRFIDIAKLIPDFARPMHDDLYAAIDIYLKEHPGMTKTEKKQLCRLMDCKRLSMEACMHAAQNDRLPLRVVVQVLFFEQVRSAMMGRGFSLMNDHTPPPPPHHHHLLGNHVMALMPPPGLLLHCRHGDAESAPDDDDDDEEDDDDRAEKPASEALGASMRKARAAKESTKLKREMYLSEQNRTCSARNHVHVINGSRTKHLFFYPKKVLRKIWSSMSRTSPNNAGNENVFQVK